MPNCIVCNTTATAEELTPCLECLAPLCQPYATEFAHCPACFDKRMRSPKRWAVVDAQREMMLLLDEDTAAYAGLVSQIERRVERLIAA